MEFIFFSGYHPDFPHYNVTITTIVLALDVMPFVLLFRGHDATLSPTQTRNLDGKSPKRPHLMVTELLRRLLRGNGKSTSATNLLYLFIFVEKGLPTLCYSRCDVTISNKE